MADLFQLSNLGTPDFDSGGGVGDPSSLKTGDLRRKYNFGDRVSELAIPQDPFFRFVSKVGKKPTDDPQFKWTEKRDSWHKRYGYVCAHGTAKPSSVTNDATVTDGNVAANDIYYFAFGADYKNKGNIQTVYGNTNTDIMVGASDTQPKFYLPGQLVKIPYGASTATFSSGAISAIEDYLVVKILEVDLDSALSEYAVCKTKVIKGTSGADIELAAYQAAGNAIDDTDLSSMSVADTLEAKRSYVMGTAHEEGSGYPETWKDQPYSTNYGRTQIWKTSMAMTNTARATVLKYDSNEWSRVWKDKLVEHKWDIEQSLLFGAQDDANYTTQGCVDYVSTYGNAFSLTTSTKTADDFLDDMSNYLDPRYNNSSATVFFCSTAVYNWMHKLGGYFKNNLELSTNFRADFAMTGKKKVMGVDITTFSTPYGDMNVARNIHLDGTNVKMLGINMKYAAYRPLVGNGVNRDTSVYVGVQTLENSGIDRRVDLILTEAGLELSMPECHALWT
jgi:hypothetical protein